MKILFCDNTLWGLLNFRGGVIQHLTESGHEIILVAPQDAMCDCSMLPEGVKHISVTLNRTGMSPIADFRYYRQLRRIYKAEKPDYIFHYTIKPNIYGTLAAHGLGIRNSAMIAGLGHVYSSGGIGNRIARWMYRYAMRYPERVMVLNRSNRDTLLEKKVVEAEKLLWLEGGEGVNLSKYTASELPGNTLPVFLMVCRLLYEKGYAEYVAAAKSLKGKADFRIMGPIDSHPTAVSRSTVESDVANGLITYIEYAPDVTLQIKKADCIVLPSYHEGLSRVLMEALAMGRPIITTDIPGCRETVDAGITGFLCQPRDAISLTEALSKFIGLTRQERMAMAMASRLKAETTFDERAVISRYEEILTGDNR